MYKSTIAFKLKKALAELSQLVLLSQAINVLSILNFFLSSESVLLSLQLVLPPLFVLYRELKIVFRNTSYTNQTLFWNKKRILLNYSIAFTSSILNSFKKSYFNYIGKFLIYFKLFSLDKKCFRILNFIFSPLLVIYTERYIVTENIQKYTETHCIQINHFSNRTIIKKVFL